MLPHEFRTPHSSFLRRRFVEPSAHAAARMRAIRANVLTPGLRGPRPFLLPAFTAIDDDWLLGSRIQLQQRNCSRFSRDSSHRLAVIYSQRTAALLVRDLIRNQGKSFINPLSAVHFHTGSRISSATCQLPPPRDVSTPSKTTGNRPGWADHQGAACNPGIAPYPINRGSFPPGDGLAAAVSLKSNTLTPQRRRP